MAETTAHSPRALYADPLAPSEIQEVVDRILESRHFAKAPLLSSFLTYICTRAREDKTTRISECEIGINVFNRPATFDPREDNIVRTYARHLRKRLQEYYATDGQHDTLCIDIPKGGYVPVFTVKPPPAVQEIEFNLDERRWVESPKERHPPFNHPPKRDRWKRWSLAFLSLVIYSLLLCWFTWHLTKPQPQTPQFGQLHFLWTELFSSARDTFVIPSDISFVILQQANRRTFSLAEYLDWFSAEAPADHLAMSYLKDKTYTSVLNLNVVSSLQRLPEIIRDRFIIRAAQNIRLDDLRDGNAILLGSNFSNPWDELFNKSLNFQFVNHPESDRYWIANLHPAPGEQAIYEATTSHDAHQTYAVIAFRPNLDHTGHVLLLQGIDAAGTQAAADMLFGAAGLQALLRTATTAQGLRGFEILIEASSLDADSHPTSARIVATRFY